jgi:alpha-ketoglutarate-dependent taurine dioxygenase
VITGKASVLTATRRRAVTGEVVTTGHLPEHPDLPLVVRPAVPGVDLARWAAEHRDRLDGWLDRHAGVLFRGFDVDSADTFEGCVAALAGDALEYRERSTPRERVTGNVYTSTEYPQTESIPLHNENSYAHTWPLRLMFFSAVPAATGGQTPIADSRRVLARISPATLARFEQYGVRYVRNLGGGLGIDWRTAFQTDDPAEVARYCAAGGYEHRWDGDRLHLSRVGPAVVRHPRTGERTWFNHTVLFHVSSLPDSVADSLRAEYGEDGLPNNTYYGDGSPIEADVLAELRAAYAAETVAFAWERGDVLVLDNMLAAHGRAPFTGARRTLVAMAQPFTSDQLAEETAHD